MNPNNNNPITDPESFNWIPENLRDISVAIWGIGLMGGSLALALRGKTRALIGIDSDSEVCKKALDLNIFDNTSTKPEEVVAFADLLVLAVPLAVIPGLLKTLPSIHPGNAVVIDLGSTKADILQAMEELPSRFAPLGGHPMCGKEVNTFAHSNSNLYDKSSFALLPLSRTPQAACNLAVKLVRAIGAHPVWLDPQTHDLWVASISHLPFIVANSLANITPLDAAPLVGPGFISTTRLASESIDMMMDILIMNRMNILSSLKSFRTQIEAIEKDLELGNLDSLRSIFLQGSIHRTAVLDAFHREVDG